MGNAYFINQDGSISKNLEKRLVNNINWIDHSRFKGKHSFWQIGAVVLCLFPVWGWGVGILSCIGIRIICGFWPFIGIRAIENSDNEIRVYCNKKGLLGLYSKKHRLTAALYTSVQYVAAEDYPSFILEKNQKYCLYNYTQGKILFKDSDAISYIGDNNVMVTRNGKTSKFSLIGMCLD